MVMVRYTGILPALFSGRIGHHEPGDVFGLLDEEIESFVHRSDIEVVDESESEPQNTLEEAEGKQETPAQAPEVSEPAPTPEPAAEPVPQTPAP